MEKMWGYLIHLGCNIGLDWDNPKYKERDAVQTDYLRCEKQAWDKIVEGIAKSGMNMLVIDLGEGVRYGSHPEIAVTGSWDVDALKGELRKMKNMGLEVIPKLNFSAMHDNWLGKYSRCVSSDIYYGVCRDLIEEVIEIFEKPRFFHLGMDEEDYGHQERLLYVTIRQYDLWWHDLYFLVNEVEKRNVRAWIWSDYLWSHREEFFTKMPTTAVQSNWHYGRDFNDEPIPLRVRAYIELDEKGYDQIPTGSSYTFEENFPLLVQFCKRKISDQHLLGFLQTPWRPTTSEYYARHLKAIEAVRKGMEVYRKI